MNWLSANLPSICILFVVIAFVAALVFSLVKSKKSGKSSCAGCSGCSMQGKCHGDCGKEENKTLS